MEDKDIQILFTLHRIAQSKSYCYKSEFIKISILHEKE